MRTVPSLVAAVLACAPAVTMALDVEEVTVTATRAPRAASEVSVGVTITDSQAIERAAPAIAVDALRGRSGVYIQQTTPGQGIPIVRGLKGSEVLHLVDGIRLNNGLFRNAPNQYVALVDPFMLSGIEVVRGPSPALYGSDAMGGVVQMITRSPRFEGPAWQHRGRVLARFDSASLGQTARVEWSGGRKGLSATGGLTWQDIDDLRAGGGREQAPSGYTARAANARVAWETDTGDWLLDAQYLTQPETPRYDELAQGFGQDAPASAVFNFEPNSRLFLHARYRTQSPLPWIDDLRLAVAYQEVDDDRRSRDADSVNERRERNESALVGLTAQAISRVGARHTLTYGAELYLDDVSSARTSRNVDTGETRTVTSRFPDGATMDSFALYVNDEFQVTDRTALTAGARLSVFRTELPPADRGIGADVDLEDLTANLGWSFRASDRVHVTANVGRGFRPPNIFDLGTLGERPGNRFNEPNADLDAESVITYDAGVKLSDARWTGELFAFYSDYSDKITSIPTGETDDAGRTIVQSRNTNTVELKGIEAGLRYEVTDAWRLSGSLTWVDGDERSPGGTTQPADRIPPLNGRLLVAHDHAAGWWAEGWLRFAAAQDELSDRDAGDPRIDPNGTPGWATVNLRGGFALRDGVMLQLNAENLLDKRYREHGSGIDAPGRNFGISIDARF